MSEPACYFSFTFVVFSPGPLRQGPDYTPGHGDEERRGGTQESQERLLAPCGECLRAVPSEGRRGQDESREWVPVILGGNHGPVLPSSLPAG